MKKFGHFIAFLIIVQIVTFCNQPLSAQKIKTEDVPGDVVQTLDYQNPGIKVQSWELVNNNYMATFKDEGSVGKIYISPTGTWLRTTYDVRESELPSSITGYVKQNYPDFIISVSCLEELENESTHYYIEVKMEGIGFEPSVLTFNYEGKLIHRTDPAGFKDPTAPKAEPKPEAAAGKTPLKAAAAKQTTTKTPTASKPASTKPAAAKQTTTKTPTASKPASTKPAATKQESTKQESTKQTAVKSTASKTPSAKSTEKEKTAKPKKEKPEVIVKDENGNIALKPNTIPAVVTQAFAKKIFHPEELNWFLIDSMYVAKCTNVGKKTVTYVSPKGVWKKTLTEQPEEAITGTMLKYLNDYYQGFKFKHAINEQRADKNNRTIVEFYEKANYKNKLVTTAIFDKSGKLIRTIDPDYTLGYQQEENAEDEDLEKYYEKMNMGLSEEEVVNVPDNVAAAFKLKYPRITNVEWQESDLNYHAIYYDSRGKQICVINNYGTIVETMTLGKPDNLSETIANYIKKEYKGSKVVEFYTVKKIADRQSCYKVLIQNKKTGEENELWFNTAGKIINI